MPVQQGPNNSPLAFYWDIPPITRVLLTFFAAVRGIQAFGYPIHLMMYLSWQHIFSHWQVWRLVTPFLYIQGKGFEVLILFLWTVQYGKALEQSVFRNNTADCLWMLIVGCSTMLGLTLIPWFSSFFLGNALVEMILYVWSKNFPTAQVSLYGLLPVQAFYLPFVYLGLSLVLGGNPIHCVLGILSGHMYYFLNNVYPASGGRRFIRTPRWLENVCARYNIGEAQASTTAAGGRGGQQAPQGFRAFTGGGRRLG